MMGFVSILKFFVFLLFIMLLVFSIGYAILSPYFGYMLYKKVIIVDVHISRILEKFEYDALKQSMKCLMYFCSVGFVFVCSFVVFSVGLLLMYVVFVL